ncbi:MAG: thermosome subunit, partial [Candidatus Korarchaeota archaeon]|nr:thermosome subunit [Candidatus Korarchaeota archaeon]
YLKMTAMTSMASKLVAEHREYLADLAVRSILQVAEKEEGKYKVDIDDVKVEKKPGESVRDTKLINGLVLDKEIVHSGMPKRIENSKIALLDSALEIEK